MTAGRARCVATVGKAGHDADKAVRPELDIAGTKARETVRQRRHKSVDIQSVVVEEGSYISRYRWKKTRGAT